jgi:hypothetical protein
VVESGGLENRCAGNRTEGSNPSPSASDPADPAHRAGLPHVVALCAAPVAGQRRPACRVVLESFFPSAFPRLSVRRQVLACSSPSRRRHGRPRSAHGTRRRDRRPQSGDAAISVAPGHPRRRRGALRSLVRVQIAAAGSVVRGRRRAALGTSPGRRSSTAWSPPSSWSSSPRMVVEKMLTQRWRPTDGDREEPAGPADSS